MTTRATGGTVRRRQEAEDPNNTWNMQLMAAVLKADLVEAAALIAKGANINHTTAEPALKGQTVTPFIAAALKGASYSYGLHGNPNAVPAAPLSVPDMVKVLQWMCRNGANPNAQIDGFKGTIFHFLVRADHAELIEKILSNRHVISEPAPPPPPTTTDVLLKEDHKGLKARPKKVVAAVVPDEAAALPTLAEPASSHEPVVGAAAPVQEDVFDLTARDESGVTAFQLAITLGKVDCGRALLKHGAQPDFSAHVDALGTAANRASAHCDTQILEMLLNLGDDPWQRDATGRTLMHTATNPAVADILVDRGLSVNLRDARGQTPLSFIVSHVASPTERIDLLTARGADIAAGDTITGLTPLMHAVIAYNGDVVKKLIVDGKADINARDAMGSTALHWAATARAKGMLEQLVQLEGADLNAADKLGQTPLHRACYALGHSDFVAVLIAKDAVDVNVPDTDGNTPLHTAVMRQNDAAVKVCLSRVDTAGGAGPPSPPPTKGGEPAAKKPPGSTKKGAPVVEHPTVAKLSIDAENKRGQTALQIASYLGAAPLIRLLVAAGADVRRTSGYGNLVHEAATHGQPDTIQLLVEKGADVNARDTNDRTPLHLAVQRDDLACVKALIECGAFVDEQDAELRTPLHLACARCCAAIRDELLASGVTATIADSSIRTPLHIACAAGDDATVDALIRHGAHVDAVDGNGQTALHVACENDAVECARRLIDGGADLWIRDDRRRTSLHAAAACGAVQCTELICSLLMRFHAGGDGAAPPAVISPRHDESSIGSVERPNSRRMGSQRPPTPAELDPRPVLKSSEGTDVAVDGAAARALFLREEAKRRSTVEAWLNALVTPDADGRYPLALAGLSGSPKVASVLVRTHAAITARHRERAGLPPRPPSVPLRPVALDL